MHLKGTDAHSDLYSSINSIFAKRKKKFYIFPVGFDWAIPAS